MKTNMYLVLILLVVGYVAGTLLVSGMTGVENKRLYPIAGAAIGGCIAVLSIGRMVK